MRIRSNLNFGTITNNPLAIGGTTVNSAQFATLPTISGDELYLTLDPEGSNREIVRVTAHTAAATSCTIQRAQLGTTAAQHDLGVRWVHGVVTTDLTVACTSSTRPSVGLWAGMTIYETDTNRPWVYSGTAWVPRGSYFKGNKNVDQSIPDATVTSVLWADVADVDGWHTGSSADIIVPTGFVGAVTVAASIKFDNHATGYRQVAISKNGVDVAVERSLPAGGLASFLNIAAQELVVGGDVLGVNVYQTRGGALDVQASGGTNVTVLFVGGAG